LDASVEIGRTEVETKSQDLGRVDLVEPTARFDPVKIPLRDAAHGLGEVSGVLGVPEWWPTGNRVSVVLAHGSASDLNEPLLELLQRELTERKLLTLRFNFPHAEAGKRTSADTPAMLEHAMRCAIAFLGRDPGAAPAHLFLVGRGLGARVATQVAAGRVRPDGLVFLGFPLHTQDRPDQVHAESLFRIVSPMLFVQGTRDRHCDLPTLRRTLLRVGAPTTLHVAQEADQNFKAPRKSERTSEEIHAEVVEIVETWIQRILD
jgi:predicted alpha/beta-hydrolase family hydrolase